MLLGYLKGPKPAIFFEFGPYFCAAALAISCYIQLSAINNGLKAEGALVLMLTSASSAIFCSLELILSHSLLMQLTIA